MNKRHWIATTAGTLVAALALTAAPAQADRHYAVAKHRAAYDFARVVSVQPIVRYVTVQTPVQECWNETRHYTVERRSSNAGGTLVGALIGGVVGHQFGSGRGNDAATVAGTLIGAAVGNDVSRSKVYSRDDYRTTRTRPVQRCETRYRSHEEERVDEYRVIYRYNGQKYATRMPYDPGRKIRVRVDVRPTVR